MVERNHFRGQGPLQITFEQMPHGPGRRIEAADDAAASVTVGLIKLGCGDFPMSEAVDEVIVHHSDCLHMCVYNSGTDEAESALF